eukprot:1444297-Pyramimonas_sp.AAC.1
MAGRQSTPRSRGVYQSLYCPLPVGDFSSSRAATAANSDLCYLPLLRCRACEPGRGARAALAKQYT